MENFRKESLIFDGVNYDSWKEKMKTNFLCMGLGYWLITKAGKEIIDENKLEECTKAKIEKYLGVIWELEKHFCELFLKISTII